MRSIGTRFRWPIATFIVARFCGIDWHEFVWPRATFTVARYCEIDWHEFVWPRAIFIVARVSEIDSHPVSVANCQIYRSALLRDRLARVRVAEGHIHRSLGQAQRRPRTPIPQTYARCRRAIPAPHGEVALQATGSFWGAQPGATPRVPLARDTRLSQATVNMAFGHEIDWHPVSVANCHIHRSAFLRDRLAPGSCGQGPHSP